MTDERRLVTVLFADVTGSTELGESMDPEDLRALLARYYAIAKDVVAWHGGTLEKFIGDAVMAVFGLRQAFGDDPERALAAALELRDRVQSDPRLGDRLPIRLGVNTGDVVASRGHEGDDFLVTGDAVNVAARLQQGAATWSILAGERTVRAAHDRFLFGPERSVAAKGKADGVRASEVLGRLRTSAARTPLFGRQADLAKLEVGARQAFEDRRPGLVTVIAPPGTGKSRLLEEFLGKLPQAVPDVRIVVAQCLPYGQQLTYWPLRTVLFRIVGLGDDALPDEVRSEIGAWLDTAVIDDAAQIGSLLASTVGAGDEAAVDRDALFAAWRTFIDSAANRAPLVIAVEDLHWSSDSLLDLLDFVLEPRADARTLMIVMARPELLDRRPTWGARQRNHASITLEPLGPDAIGDLVRHLAEGAPSGFVDAVVDRAEGNPFYAGEIVSTLVESVGSLDDSGEVKKALARLPDTVQATVLARLDLLPADERDVIRMGAVFGGTFRPTGVASLTADSKASDVSAACTRLVARDMIRPAGADGFAFRHILIREVAYSTLLRASRAQLHGAAGRWLEEQTKGRDEEFAELVAYHYREAASLAVAMQLEDVDELRDKARMWLVKAARVAESAAASVEALGHARAAFEYGRPEDMPDMYELLGDVEIGGGAVVDAYKKALELASDMGLGANDELRVLAKLLMVETRAQGSVAIRPSYSELNTLRKRGQGLLDRATDPTARAMFLIADAFYPFWLRGDERSAGPDELDSAGASAREGLELARLLDNANLQSAAFDALGFLALARHDWKDAIDLGQERMAMGARLSLFEQIDAYSVTTQSAVYSGDLVTAERVSAGGFALLQPGRAPAWGLQLSAWRTLVLQLIGKWDEVEATADRANGMWLDSGRPAAGYSMRGWLAALVVARARRDGDRIAMWEEAIGEIGGQFAFWRTAAGALVNWDLGELGASIESASDQATFRFFDVLALYMSLCNDSSRRFGNAFLTEALARARSARALPLEGETLRALGLARDDPTLLDQANAIFDNCGVMPYVARTRCEAAILRHDNSELEAGIAYLESIRDDVQVERYRRALT